MKNTVFALTALLLFALGGCAASGGFDTGILDIYDASQHFATRELVRAVG